MSAVPQNPGQMKEHAQFKVAYAWLKLEKPTINESDCICLPCVKQIQRNHDNLTPRWLPKPPILPKKCNMEHCEAMVDTQTSLVTVNELENILKERVNAFTVSTSKQSIGLCRKHYKQMYAFLYHTPCDSCDDKPKRGEVFSRHCPSPALVNGYLSYIYRD